MKDGFLDYFRGPVCGAIHPFHAEHPSKFGVLTDCDRQALHTLTKTAG